MGAFQKITDALLFLFFLFVAIGGPLIDSQTILPTQLFPDVLKDLKQWYIHEFQYYLHVEKPSFYVGILWLVILLLWPLSLFNLYGLLKNKSWFPNTCIISGVSGFTAVVTILFEMIESGKASNKLIILYFFLMGLGILATLRGLVLRCSNTVPGIDRHTVPGKKKA